MQNQEKKSVRPPRLKPGDTIGIVAPAGPFDPEKFMKGKSVLESMGFQTVFEDGIFQKHGFLEGIDIQREDQGNGLFVDSKVLAIFLASLFS